MKQFYYCISIFVALEEPERDEWGPASCCEVIPLLPDKDSTYTKQTKAHFLLSFQVDTREPHTQPPIECRKQTDALLVLNKGDSSQSSTHCRWNWGLSLDSGWDPCDWGSDLKGLSGSYTCEAQEQGSKKSRNKGNILSHTCAPACADKWTSCTDGVNKNWFYCLWRNSAIILCVSLPSAASLCSGCVCYILYVCWQNSIQPISFCLISTSYRSWFPQRPRHMWCRVHSHGTVCLFVCNTNIN